MDSSINSFERKLALEQIISRMARNFVRFENAATGIHTALREIGEFSGASRAYIFEFKSDGLLMDNTYEWCSPGVTAEIDNLKDQEIGVFGWWMEKIRQGDVLNIHDVSTLGPEAQAEKEILEMQDIKSVLVMPLMKRGELCGFVGFDNVESVGVWKEEDTSALSIAAELFSNVFDRLAYEKEINDAKDELEASLNSLQFLQAKLIQQEQLAAIGQLAAGVAHEINNPLGFVLSNQKTLRKYSEKLLTYANSCFLDQGKPAFTEKDAKEVAYIQDDLSELFDDIDIGLLRVKKIVESLRFFSRIDSIQSFEPYNIAEGLSNTLVIIHSRLSDSVSLELDIPDNLPNLVVHGSKINQVLLNLIINALDAIEERHPLKGGTLKIQMGTVGKQVPLGQGNKIKISIIDNGIGMSEETKQKIFNPFYTTKAIGKGTGLGMILVYDIVKNIHKGEIEIISEPDEGATVSITLGDVVLTD